MMVVIMIIVIEIVIVVHAVLAGALVKVDVKA